MQIGQLLAELRRAANLSQREVAHDLGISPSYLSDMETGRRPFSDERAEYLPDEIRGPVIAAIINNLHARIERLRGQMPPLAGDEAA